MEGGSALNGSVGTIVDSWKKLRSSESGLWGAASKEDRSIIDGNLHSFRFWEIEQ